MPTWFTAKHPVIYRGTFLPAGKSIRISDGDIDEMKLVGMVTVENEPESEPEKTTKKASTAKGKK